MFPVWTFGPQGTRHYSKHLNTSVARAAIVTELHMLLLFQRCMLTAHDVPGRPMVGAQIGAVDLV